MGNFLIRFLSKNIPPNTRKTVCPPGELQTTVQKRSLVVIASFPRSGTHVLMDLILNNFPSYRRSPLYVNLDEYIRQGLDVDELIRVGGYLVKTHYPESTFSALDREAYERVFDHALILSPRRSEQQIATSFQRMTDVKRRSEVLTAHRTYLEYWDSRPIQVFNFSDLINPSATQGILNCISKLLDAQRSPKQVGPPDRKRYLRVMMRKLATRLFGNRLSRVNTTVGFAKTKHSD